MQFLYKVLFIYDWSCMYSQTSPDSAAQHLSSAVIKALNLSIPCTCHDRSKYQQWFSNTLKYYISRKSHFYHRYKKNQSLDAYSAISCFHKLIKTTIKSERLCWLKSLDDSIKTQPSDFWKYVTNFKSRDNNFINLNIDGQIVTDSNNIAHAFTLHFESTYNSYSPSSIFPHF